MGDYRFLPDKTDDTTGIMRTADSVRIPPDTRNGAWLDYLAWKAVPNTPDPATATSLTDWKKQKKIALDRVAQDEFAKDLRLQGPLSPALALALGRLIDEAVEIDVAGVPFSSGRHPMINQLIGTEGASGAAVATAINTWWSGIKVRVGQVLKEIWKAHKDVNAAANLAAVNAVSPTWPGGGAGE